MRQAATSAPPLLPALAAMTGLQALVALALFAPGVLGPQLGYGEGAISLFATACFSVGAATSLYGGLLAARLGSFMVAALCALAVAVAMAVASLGTLAALLVSGIIVGLAFGPETPASSTLLARLARPEQRPLIFSVRQTGNQIGAMTGFADAACDRARRPAGGICRDRCSGARRRRRLSRAARTLRRHSPAGRRSGSTGASSRPPRAQRAGARPACAGVDALFRHAARAQRLLRHLRHRAAARLPYVAAGLLLAVAQAGGLVGRLGWGWVATPCSTDARRHRRPRPGDGRARHPRRLHGAGMAPADGRRPSRCCLRPHRQRLERRVPRRGGPARAGGTRRRGHRRRAHGQLRAGC